MLKSDFIELFEKMALMWDVKYSEDRLYEKGTVLYDNIKILGNINDENIKEAFKCLTAIQSEDVQNPFKGNLIYNFKNALRKVGYRLIKENDNEEVKFNPPPEEVLIEMENSKFGFLKKFAKSIRDKIKKDGGVPF